MLLIKCTAQHLSTLHRFPRLSLPAHWEGFISHSVYRWRKWGSETTSEWRKTSGPLQLRTGEPGIWTQVCFNPKPLFSLHSEGTQLPQIFLDVVEHTGTTPLAWLMIGQNVKENKATFCVFMTSVHPETSALEYLSNLFASCWEL